MFKEEIEAHLVRRGVGRLVQVDDATANILCNGPLERRAARRQRRVVPRANVQLVIVLLNGDVILGGSVLVGVDGRV